MKRRGNQEGTVYQRKDGRWTAQIRLEDPYTGLTKRHQIYGRTRVDVVDQLNELRRRVKRGEPAADVRTTVRELVERWYRDVASPQCRASTLADYRNAIDKQIIPQLGDFRIARVRPATIEHLICGSAGIGAPSTRARALKVLKAAFKAGIRWRLIVENPAEDLKAPKTTKREISPMTPEHLDRFLTAARRRRLFAMYAFAAFTGARQGEIFALRWTDIDLQRNAARIPGTLNRDTRTVHATKTLRSYRTITLTPRLCEVLREHRDRYPSRSGHVFETEGGRPLNARNVVREFKEVLVDAGLAEQRLRDGKPMRGATAARSFRFHDLRHTFATLSLLAGIPMKAVSEQLGHATLAMTADTYTHVLPVMMSDAAIALDAYFLRVTSTAIPTAIAANAAVADPLKRARS